MEILGHLAALVVLVAVPVLVIRGFVLACLECCRDD